ncbi:hypothetical protein ACLQ2R_28710 [Streptosporangium sp. DT93]|uniref:hypothetical protein n=1 Tax=Streptosporangium sp. DT93 TaxID=3393428 RepID=UPI003CEEEF0F
MANMDADHFHEDDEPVEKIVAAFGRGEKQLTRRPGQGCGEHAPPAGVVHNVQRPAKTSYPKI